jgi:hypothetical protein
MIKMAVRQEDMIDCRQLLERETGDARARIDQDIVIQQEAGGVPATAYAAGTAQYFQFHDYFVV